jgi:hypothetical protein
MNTARKPETAQSVKGQIVRVVGYVHEREQQTKTGRKIVKELCAMVVKQQ